MNANNHYNESVASYNSMERLLDLTDEALLTMYRESASSDAFATLVKRYERELYAYLRRYLADATAAEDVFQATFVSVHSRLDQFVEGKRFKPWLYAIATNKAIDFKRSMKRRTYVSLDHTTKSSDDGAGSSLASSIPAKAMDPSQSLMDSEKSERVRSVLAELNEPTQLLLNLVYYQGLKYADISEALGIPVGTVKSRVFNAMRKLNELWHRKYGESTQEN